MSCPDSCATCGRMVFRHAVTCVGPCGLASHLTCTTLQLDAEPSFFDELTWLCDGCRVILKLPPEVWTEIFGLLDVPELLGIRRTCRAWKQIVDESPTLRWRLKVRIAGLGLSQDQNYYDPGVIPCAAGAIISVRRIVSVNSWWSAFAEKLRYLELADCRVHISSLLEMLRQVPLLKELKLTNLSQLDGVGSVGDVFKLVNLEKLALSTSNERDRRRFLPLVLALLAEICPRLKYLAVHGTKNQNALIRMAKAAQTTLKGIKFEATNTILEGLSKLEQLELKHVAILHTISYDRNYFAMFFRSQRSVVELSLCQNALEFLTDKEFARLKLVSLKIELNKTATLNIGRMPTLKKLEVVTYSVGRPTIRFGICQTPNLQEFRLCRLCIVGNNLTNFLAHLRALQLLQMAQIDTDESLDLGTLPLRTFNALKTLRIDQSNVPLRDLFRLCPNLEDLELTSIWKVDDELVLNLCQQLKRLRRLALACWLHDAAAHRIMEHHGPELRLLELNDIRSLHEGTKRKLVEHFASSCGVVRFGWRGSQNCQLDLMKF